MEKLRGIHEVLSEEEVSGFLSEAYPDMNESIEFEPFLKVWWVDQAYTMLLKFHLQGQNLV
jgi:plastin-1